MAPFFPRGRPSTPTCILEIADLNEATAAWPRSLVFCAHAKKFATAVTGAENGSTGGNWSLNHCM